VHHLAQRRVREDGLDEVGLDQLGGLADRIALDELGDFGAGLIIFMRGLMMTTQRAPLPDGSTGWRDDGERSEADSGFDPDAAIARYLQNRADGVPSPISDAASGVPQRPTFGRKQT
jgi:hypothetical protein